MAQPAYAKANQRTGLWLTISFAGIAAQIAIMFLLSATGWTDRLGGWVLLIGGLPLILAFIIGWIVLARLHRERIGRIGGFLTQHGYAINGNPTDAERTQFAAPLIHLFPTLGLHIGDVAIRWFAASGAGSVKMRLFEHSYITGSGKFRQEHLHTIAAWPAGHSELRDAGLPNAPWFMMSRYPWLKRRTVKNVELKNPEFADLARDWSSIGDAATGIRFLNPTVRAALLRSRRGEAWCMGAGWICCTCDTSLDAENMEKFLSYCREVVTSEQVAVLPSSS